MGIGGFIGANLRFLTSGFMLALTSSYGQTFFIAIFAAQIMEAAALSDGGWGLLYMVSTMASATAMFWVGTLTDRFRVRALAAVVLPGLALTCLWMSLAETAAALLAIVFLLRLFGQGMCSHLAVVAMARWFVARRGLALSISAMGYAFGTAIFPVTFAWALEFADWRDLWRIGAVIILLTWPFIWWLLGSERTPAALADEPQAAGMEGHHWSRPRMLRHPLFWWLLPMLLGPPTWGTALFFQQVHIAETKGFALAAYLAAVPLMMVVAVVSTFLSGHIIDRIGTPRLVRAYLLPWAIGFALLWWAASLWGVALAFVFFGMAQGMQATVPAAFWAEFYGTRHLGAIKAAATSVMVLGSALGPGISGVLIDLGVSFPAQMPWIAVYFLAAAACVWVAVARYGTDLPSARKVNVVGA